MQRFFLFLFVLFFIGPGCKKPLKDYTIYGTVTDTITGQPLPGVRVELDITYSTNIVGSTIHRGVFSAYTDASGNYSMIIRDADRKREKVKSYSFTITGDAIYGYGRYSYVSPEYSRDKRTEINFLFKGAGSYKISLNNANPVNANDAITGIYFDNAGDIYLGNSIYTGTSVSHEFSGMTASGPRVLHYTVTKNNTTLAYADTIVVPAYPDTLFYQLNY